MTCNNPFHVGQRSDIHSGILECMPRRLKSGDMCCMNRCHTHPERVSSNLDMDGCIRLFSAMVNGHIPPFLSRISEMERKEVARFYLGFDEEEMARMGMTA